MTTTINYKVLTVSKKATRNKETYSKAEFIYSPNVLEEHSINLVRPDTTLLEIEQTIYEEKIIRSFKSTSPLYSFVGHLN